jgi:hypothetical protein
MDDDKKRAADYRAKLTALLGSVCDVMNDAQAHDFIVSFAIGKDAANRSCVQAVDISKRM